MDLYSQTLPEREQAAAEHRTFAQPVKIPEEYKHYWLHTNETGKDWPTTMVDLAKDTVWPEHAFGTANAALVIFWHRPGLGTSDLPAGAHIGPRLPVLGGLPHPHVKHWPELHPSKSWHLLHKYLAQAFDGFGLNDHLSQVMVACVNPEPSPTGAVDVAANHASATPGGAMDVVTRLCQPRVVLLCGREVQAVGPIYRERHPNVTTLEVSHPVGWEGFGGAKMRGDEVARVIRAALNGKPTGRDVHLTVKEYRPKANQPIKIPVSRHDFTDMVARIKAAHLRKFAANVAAVLPIDCDVTRVMDMWVIKLDGKTIAEIHPREDYLLFAIRKPRDGDIEMISTCGKLQSDRSSTERHPYISFRAISESHLANTQKLLNKLIDRER